MKIFEVAVRLTVCTIIGSVGSLYAGEDPQPVVPEPSLAASAESVLSNVLTASAPATSATPAAALGASAPAPAPAPAPLLDRAQPKWLKLSGEFRTRGEGRTAFGFVEGNNDAYGLTRLRLNIDMTPTPWLQMFFQGQDSRVIGIDESRKNVPIFRNPADIRQAYVYLKDRETGWIGLKAGRQLLVYGSQRLVGALDWTNTSRTFDAVKLELGRENARVDIFSASVVANNPFASDHHRDGQNLHGAYSMFKKVVPNSVFEPYLLLKTNPRVIGETGRVGSLGVYTAGFRLASLPGTANKTKGFDYNIEVAKQMGDFASGDISAWASATTVGYTVANAPLKPRVFVEYSYASGDSDPTDGKNGTFDQLYPTAHLWYGYTDNVGWKNIHNPRVGVNFSLSKKVKLNFDYHWFWLADRHDHLYNVGSVATVRSPAEGAEFTDVGSEFDVTVAYKLSSSLTLGAGFGHLFPGKYLQLYSPGSSTSFPYMFLAYKF
jgi:hypothetical protein